MSKITKSALASEWRGFIGTQLQIDGYYRYATGDSKRRMLTAAKGTYTEEDVKAQVGQHHRYYRHAHGHYPADSGCSGVDVG